MVTTGQRNTTLPKLTTSPARHRREEEGGVAHNQERRQLTSQALLALQVTVAWPLNLAPWVVHVVLQGGRTDGHG